MARRSRQKTRRELRARLAVAEIRAQELTTLSQDPMAFLDKPSQVRQAVSSIAEAISELSAALRIVEREDD